jgi:Photosynthetic reaction centre cytochrome C subunit
MNTSAKTTMYGAALLFCCLLAAAQIPAPSADKKSSEVYKNVKVLKDVPSDQLVPSMKFTSSSLGVRCEYCHVEKAFDKDDKKEKQIARKMIQMVSAINTNNFDGHQEVTCYSCHRGNPRPVAVPIISDSMPKLLNEPVPEPQPNSPDLAQEAQIIEKYVAAIGGTAAISNLTSLSEHGDMSVGARQFQMDVLIKSPNRIATITHFPGANGTTALEGTAGWVSFPGNPVHPMSAAEVDAGRIDADLHFPLDLKTFFTELEVKKKVTIGEKETILLVGKRSGLPPVEMYFDSQTGFLARVVHYEASALGLNPTQIDYSDYREVSGVKLPFHLVSANPAGRFTVQIASAEVNVPIRDDVFVKPASPPANAQ